MTRNVMERTGEQRWPNGQGRNRCLPKWAMSALPPIPEAGKESETKLTWSHFLPVFRGGYWHSLHGVDPRNLLASPLVVNQVNIVMRWNERFKEPPVAPRCVVPFALIINVCVLWEV